MGLSDMLALAETPEEKNEVRESFLRLRQKMRDNDIDFSDIPEITDFTGWKPAKPHFDKMREHNRRIDEERERRKAMNETD
ncbi:MAG: hypothetical protein IJP97_07065 [Synergistaceae bacterium]|nr:hypothetical protein [Synergistaceae bacterium]MBR0070238.1 hypothetical protein [Synergistaceae bacterium]